jgi:hypothetical protein
MVNNTAIIYESLEGSRPTFRWCWQVHDLDLGLVCPYPGIWGSTQKAGIVPKYQVLDNQASAAYMKAIGDSDKAYELVPLDNHRCNMAEKAIQTFKDHCVGVLRGCATFPLHLWCQLLPQVERQLFLLQQL